MDRLLEESLEWRDKKYSASYGHLDLLRQCFDYGKPKVS